MGRMWGWGYEIWCTAWGPFLWSLEEDIMVLAATAKAWVSYHTLLRNCEGCGSNMRDAWYRTSDCE
jgi:hypothetical protein